MNFHVRKRRQAPTIIIVALIDVLIVLLIFLMVTTTFRQQPSLRLALPESSQAKKTGADEKELPLVVSIDATGNLRLGAEARPVTAEQLLSELTVKASLNPQLKLAISADKGAPFGQIVKVMDAAKSANITAVNAFTKEAKP